MIEPCGTPYFIICRGWKHQPSCSYLCECVCVCNSRRGSLGPSTVILMALWYVATWGGLVNTVMVRVKLFPKRGKEIKSSRNTGRVIGVVVVERWEDKTKEERRKNEFISIKIYFNQYCPLAFRYLLYFSPLLSSSPQISFWPAWYIKSWTPETRHIHGWKKKCRDRLIHLVFM